MIKHYFEFITSGRGMKEIGEPEGFDGATFDIQQRLHGRDVAFAGGKSAFRIYKNSQLFYAWDDVMYELAVYGYNANIRQLINFHGEFVEIGKVDCGENRKTDLATYFEYNLVQMNIYTLPSKRSEMPFNILGNQTVDGGFIAPVQTSKILLPSNPAKYKSSWNNPTIGRETFFDNPGTNPDFFNMIKNVTKSDIKNTLSWLEDASSDSNSVRSDNFKHIHAQDKLSNITVQMNYNIRFDYLPTRNNNLPDHNGRVVLRAFVGQQAEGGQFEQYDIWDSGLLTGNSNQTINLPTSFTLNIPSIDRTNYLWISFISSTQNGAVNKLIFNECETIITATAEGYNSIIQGVRLNDAMKQVAKGVSGNNVSAPRWEMGGNEYNQFVTTQDLMRNQNDKPFILSYKDISEDYLREVDGDYEIQKDGTIFYGTFEDYYTNQEIAILDNPATDEFYITINPDFYCNQFNYAYKNYQSQKELEEQNSGDIIHGKKQMSFASKETQNTKDVSIGFIRDALLIEVMRRKAVELTKETATQDDDKIVLLDCINNTENRNFTERALLKHSKVDDTTLILNSVVISSVENGSETLNSGDPNFLILGIVPNSQFIISGEQINAGVYSVISVNGSEIRLNLTTPGTLQSNDGINTTFVYRILSSDVPFIARTNQGITATNISAPDKTVNLNYSVNRNIINYYSQFIATQTLFEQDKTVRTRVYDNNPDAVINGIREGDDITASNPILTPNLIISEIFCTLEQWKQLEATLRLNRGFIRVMDANGLPLRGYFKEGKWNADTSKPTRNSNYYGKAIITLKERYFPTRLTIQSDSGTVILNDTIMPSGYRYKIDVVSGKISIFDAVGKRLNVPVIFKEVTVNSVVPNSIAQLEELMQNI